MKFQGNKVKMKQKFHRFLSGFMALLMVVSMIPTTALVTEASADDAVYSITGQVNGKSVSIPQDDMKIKNHKDNETMFYVRWPKSVTADDGSTAEFAGWADETVVAYVTTPLKAGFAVGTQDDSVARRLVFKLMDDWQTDFNNVTEVTIAAGIYLSTYEVTADNGNAASVRWGETYTVPTTTTTTSVPEGKSLLGWQDADGNMYSVGQELVITKTLTLTPVIGYEAEQYVIVYQDGVGNVLSSGIVDRSSETGTADATVLKPADPTREGYTFAGWDVEEDELAAVSGNTVVTAKWTADSHTLTYTADDKWNIADSTLPQSAATDSMVSVKVVAKEGYSVDGVVVKDASDTVVPVSVSNMSGSVLEFQIKMPSKNVTVTPVFGENNVTVKFLQEDGSLLDTQTYKYGDTIVPPAVPTKTGSVNGIWTEQKTGEPIGVDATATKDMVYIAKYDLGSYKVTVQQAGETVEGTKAELDGTDNAGFYQFGETVKINVNAPEGYRVKSVTAANSKDLDQVLSVATITEGEKYSFTMPAFEVAVTVTFEKEPGAVYTIKYMVGDRLHNVESVAVDNVIPVPAAPEMTGYTFDGWYNGESKLNPDTKATTDVTYTAKYKVNQYDVSVEISPDACSGKVTAAQAADFGSVVTVKVEDVTNYVLKNIVAEWDNGTGKEGLSLVPTATAGEYTFTMPAGKVTVKAVYENVPTGTTLVKYMSDGTFYDYQFITKGSVTTVTVEDPVKEGYTFLGWSCDGGKTSVKKDSKIFADADAPDVVTYVAYWDAEKYGVSYELDGGKTDKTLSSGSLSYGSELTLPSAPTKEGYTFAGWLSSQTNVVYGAGSRYVITGDVTFTAQWNISQYTVKFVSDGKLCDVVTYNHGEVIVPPASEPTKTGYTFKGWFFGDDKLNTNTKAETDITYTAVFEADIYALELDVTPDSCKNLVSCQNNAKCDDLVTLNVGTPTGYVLKSITADWNNGKEGVVVVPTNAEGVYTFVMPAGNVKIHVVYEEVPAGTTLVKYMDGGILYDYQIVTKGAQSTVAAIDPTKAGYEFSGWSCTKGANLLKNGDGFAVASDAEDVIVYEAYWKADSYQVMFDLNGGSGSVSTLPASYGEEVTLLPAPTKDGNVFTGWLCSDTNILYNAGAKYTVKGNVTFTAQWTASEYVVKFVDEETDVVYGYEAVSHNTDIDTPKPVKTGYEFTGWKKSGSSNVTIYPGATLKVTESAVYVAVWTVKEYQVTSSGTNCQVDPATKKVAYNDTMTFKVVSNQNFSVETVYITYTENGTKEVKVLTADQDGSYQFTMPGADVQIVATAKQTIYQISKDNDLKTNIICNEQKAKIGTDVSFTVKSTDENYSVGNVYVVADDGTRVPVTVEISDQGEVIYHFTMPEQDVTIKSQAVQGEFTVTYLNSDNTLLAQKIVKAGESTDMMVAPAAEKGYVFAGWKLLMGDNNTVYAEGKSVTVEADMFLQATYKGVQKEVFAGEKENICYLKADQGQGMSNSVDLLIKKGQTGAEVYQSLTAEVGTMVYFQVAADYNWQITDITITSKENNSDLVVVPTLIAKSTLAEQEGPTELLTYAFTMPAETVQINVYTQAKEYNVKVTENIPDAGTYTINGYTTTNRDVAQGSTVAVAVKEKAGYYVENVVGKYTNKSNHEATVSGSFDQSTGLYTFTMVPFDVEVTITYVPYEYNVNVTDSNTQTYDPQKTGTFGSAEELETVDNKGYVALLDGQGQEILDDGKVAGVTTGIYRPANEEYQVGDLVSFVVKAYRGWVADQVTVTYAGGTKSCQLTQKDGIYYFNMPAATDVKITAQFTKAVYTVTKNVEGEKHGTIVMNGLSENRISSAYKDAVTVEVTPDAGYYVKNITYKVKDSDANDFSMAASYTSDVQTDVLDSTHTLTFKTPSSDVDVTVEYAKVNYTLQTVVNGDGSLVLSATTANVGDVIDVITAPSYGYKLVKLEIATDSGKKVAFTENPTESESGTGSYYFTMPAEAVVVTATYEKVDYVVTYKDVNDAVIAMEGVTYKATADVAGHVNDVVTAPIGQHFVGWLSEDVETPVSAPSVKNADFVVIKDTTIVASYEYDYTNVRFADTVNGTVSSSDKHTSPEFTLNCRYNDQITFTATPESGYEIDTVQISTFDKDGNPTLVAYTAKITSKVGTYKFTIPATFKANVHTAESTDVVVTVTFKKSAYTLTQKSDCGTNGTIAVNGQIATQTSFEYAYKDQVTITATPDAGYYVKSIVASYVANAQTYTFEENGIAPAMDTAAGDPLTLTFDMPAYDVTYKVVYEKIDYSITRVFNAVHGTVETLNKQNDAIDKAQIDDQVNVKVTPKKGYALKSLTVTYDNGTQTVVLTGLAENTFTFSMPAKAVTVTAVFTEVTYTAKLTKKGEGDVTLNTYFTETMNADYLDTVTINANPADGWHLVSITVTGDDEVGNVAVSPAISKEGGDYTFTMPNCNVKVDVVFAKNDYSIKVVNDDTQGTVVTTPTGVAQVDDVVKVKVTPKQGYALDDLSVTYANGEKSVALTKISDNNYTFTMPAADVTVTVTYKTVVYDIALNQTGEGAVLMNGHHTKKIEDNYTNTVTLDITPAEGWKLTSVKVNDGDVAVSPAVKAEGGSYTFTMPNRDVKVDVVFTKIDYTIKVVSDSTMGTVATTPASKAQIGDIVKVAVTPKKGYELDKLTITYADGEKSVKLTQLSENNYAFTMPAADVTVTATYKTVVYDVTLVQTGEGVVRLNGHDSTQIEENYTNTVTVDITPEDGWKLVSVTVNDGKVDVTPEVVENGGEYTFTMPNEDVVVSVELKKITNTVKTYVVNAYEDGHGTVSMSTESGQVGDRMVITADPDDGYRVKHVVVTDKAGNSVPVFFVSDGTDNVETWSFTMPASEVEVKVVFEVYAASYYTDCRSDDWYYEAATYLTDKGWMTGMTPDLFGPEILMTREMFVTVLARMEGIDVADWTGVETGFTDVDVNEWYAPYIAWAKENNVTTGYSDESGRFGVADPITREQMFTMMYRYAELKGLDMTVTYPDFMDRYEDKDLISEYAYDALVWCVSEGIAKGMDPSTINPLDYAPRAHAAQMFKNYADYTFYR